MSRTLIEYLKKQRDERKKRLDAYNDALAELEAAQKRVDAFGDMGGIEGEIDELDGYIEDESAKIATAKSEPYDQPSTESTSVCETVVGDSDVEGVVDEVVATCKA